MRHSLTLIIAMMDALIIGLAANSTAGKARIRLCAATLSILGLPVLGLSALAMPSQAQSNQPTHELLPLTARELDVPGESIGLEQVSETMNAQMESDRQSTDNHLQLDSLPIIGDLVDEAGNLDMGINLPFDMSISDVMGETGLVLSTDFTVN